MDPWRVLESMHRRLGHTHGWRIAGLLGLVGCGEAGERPSTTSSESTSTGGEASLTIVTVADPSSGSGSPEAVTERVNAVLAEVESAGFSGAVLMRYQGRVLADAAFGYADREAQIPNETTTIFDMGSLTKQLTGAAIVSLHQHGLLDVHDGLQTFFDDVPPDKADITIHQLLTHTSGLPDAIGNDDDWIDRDTLLDESWTTPLRREPGGRYEYSNLGYSILAAIIERTSSLGYEAALRERILSPSEMEHTGYRMLADPQRIARGYREGAQPLPPDLFWAEEGPSWHLVGNGGLLTTTHDLLRWHDALAEHRVLDAAATNLYQTPYVEEFLADSKYAYGWVVEETPAGTLLWHDGGNEYFFAEVLRFVEADLVVIMLANEQTESSLTLARTLAAAALPELEAWATPPDAAGLFGCMELCQEALPSLCSATDSAACLQQCTADEAMIGEPAPACVDAYLVWTDCATGNIESMPESICNTALGWYERHALPGPEATCYAALVAFAAACGLAD